MIVRLHNLSARYPSFRDAAAVADLLRTCEYDELERAEITEEAISRGWHAANFQLKTDAWVIVTKKGQVVSYAEVRQHTLGQFTMLLHVHPDYRSRGIGTLLIWLIEERARQQMLDIREDTRISLGTTISSLNHSARQLLEREGYTRIHHFWRLLIDMGAVAEQAYRGKLRVDMVVDAHNTTETVPVQQPTGMYIARQYEVYEKVLRIAGIPPQLSNELQYEALPV